MARSSKRALKDLVFALNASERPVSVTGAAGGFSAMLLALLQRELDRPIILVTATQARAAELRDGLSFFAEDGPLPAAVLLPQPDVTPWHPITPNRTGTLERLATLYRLATDSTVRFAVMPAPVLATRTIPRSELMSASAMVRVDDDLDRDQFARQLDGAGYVRVPVVEDPGTYALRGGIVDVWPGVSAQPVRIDLFGDLVESLKRFDPETQRSREKLTALWIPPARDILLNDDTILRGRSALRQQAGELGIPTQRVRAVLAELDEGIWPLGVEGWLPAFYEDLSTVADFVPDNALWCFEDPSEIRTTLDAQYEAGETLYGEATERAQLAFPPSQVYSTAVPDAQLRLLNVAWEEDLADTHHVAIKYQAHADLQKAIEERRGEDHAFEPAAERVRGWVSKGKLPIVVGASAGHAERLRGLFAHYGLKTRTWDGVFSLDRVEAIREAEIEVNIFVGRLARGFGFGDLAFLGADDVVPQRRREHHRKVKGFQEASLESFRQLDPGNLIVHIDHGIGRYEGLFKLVAGGIAGDYLKLSYRGDDVLYVPVYKLDRVQRYVGGEDAAPRLDKLGGVTWEKSHARAKKAAENIARELISLQAARQARKREAYSPIDDYFEEFAASFPWDETPDQQRAIDDIMQDMDSEQPMDRLVCGDVGYGKTEVAMRAAFRAILDRKQVAVLVPTTVLAEQHRLTFEDRFRGYPVTIAALSRFRTREQEKKIITQLTAGRVDIVIGTHRMLSKDVQFRDLGLIIVDEEHRFGVKHKEKLKMVKEMADVLTLTATPIPRTLNMSLSGLRDMSIIATPPTDRLAVRTLVSRIRDEVMVEALERELDRHGQAYVVHNRVDSIYALADRLQKLVPRGRFVVAHGQMKESELEKAMLRFMAGEADVLVCTTIIESGLDIPRANTMLIHRADRLGLAQLYQLRGRVGRSNRRAYCYLLIPEPKNLAGLALKRVEAMQRFSDLGSGFHIAAMDMELRGAGNLLGSKQSGHVKEVGLDLFCELLAEAVRKLEGRVDDPLRHVSCEMKVTVAAFLPEEYVPDVHLRLFFYKRIASSRTREELEESFSDLADRCGRPPEEAQNLFEVTDLKVRAQSLGARTCSYAAGGIALGLDPASPLAGEAIVTLLQRPRSRWKLTPEVELVRDVSAAEWAKGFAAAREAIAELANFAEQRGLLPS